MRPDVVLQREPGILPGHPRDRLRRQMKNIVRPALLNNEADDFQAREFRRIELQPILDVDNIVDFAVNRAGHLPVGVRQQVFGQMAADKTGDAGDECAQNASRIAYCVLRIAIANCELRIAYCVKIIAQDDGEGKESAGLC